MNKFATDFQTVIMEMMKTLQPLLLVSYI